MLPDDVLLTIFDFCAGEDRYTKKGIEAWWQTLVHVRRRWRTVVFGSPRRLKLRLACVPETPAKELDVWPALPLVILDGDSISEARGIDNIIAALEHSNRVYRIRLLELGSSSLEEVLAAMQVPFPDLTCLRLSSKDETAVAPDAFLGGSAPLLLSFSSSHISFPGLPKFLLSATHLNSLDIQDIPHSGYFSPETLLTALSVFPRLTSLSLGFRSPRSSPDQAGRRLHPPKRTVLPVLTSIDFTGVSEYLEDLVAGIDAPQLDDLFIRFFNDVVFDTPQLSQFISGSPPLKSLETAYVSFSDRVAKVRLTPRTPGFRCLPELNVIILCNGLDWQVSSLEQVCTSSLPTLSMLEDLYISQNPISQPDWKDNIDNVSWVELLHPFIAVKNLYLSEKFSPRIVPALQELVGGRSTEVLPALQNIFLEGLQPSGPVQEGIRQFVAMRQVTDHPIAVSRWDVDRTRLYY
jgi:hypothetical protein